MSYSSAVGVNTGAAGAANANATKAKMLKDQQNQWRGGGGTTKKKTTAKKSTANKVAPSGQFGSGTLTKQPRQTSSSTNAASGGYPTVDPYMPPTQTQLPPAYMSQQYAMPDMSFNLPPAYMPQNNYQPPAQQQLDAYMPNNSYQVPQMQQLPPAFMSDPSGYQPQQTQFNQQQYTPQATQLYQGYTPGSGVEHIPQAYQPQNLSQQQMNLPQNYAPQGSAYTSQGGDIYGGRRVEDYRQLLGPSPINWPTPGGSGGQGGAGGGGGMGGGAGGGMGGLTSGLGQVGTNTPAPQEIFSPSMTQGMVNQAAQTAFTNGDPTYLMKQNTQPGVSHSAGTLASIMPQMQAFNTEARAAQQMIPLQNQMANQSHLANAQYQQGQQGLDQFNLLRQLQNQQSDFSAGLFNSAMSPLFGSLFA